MKIDLAKAHKHHEGICCTGPFPKALEAFLRPTGLLKLAEALEEKVWVTIIIALLISLAAASPYLPGKPFSQTLPILQSAWDRRMSHREHYLTVKHG